MKLYTDKELTIPGTEVMDDINSYFAHAKHTRSSKHKNVLVPQPSDDPHDPLNWKWQWKMAVIIIQGFFVLSSVMSNLAIAPLTPVYVEYFKKTPSQIALLTGATVMSLGYANFIIVPSAELFGRRTVLLICALVCVGADIWQATATSYSSFMGARVLVGLGAAANESMMTMTIADVFFLHERGKYMCFYFFCYFNGLFIGPIISGVIASRTSWRWFFWACTIAQAASTVSMIFFFPETRYFRNIILNQEQIASSDKSVDSGKLESAAVEFAEDSTVGIEEISANPASTGDTSVLGTGKPNRSQFKLWQPKFPNVVKSIIRHTLTPFQLAFFPIVLWAAVTMGAAADALLGVNLLQSQALSAPPYNFSPNSVGYANFALVAGGTIGVLTAGPSSDWIASVLTRRNNGIREPEMRLWSLVPYLLLVVVGMTVVGYGFQESLPWPAVIVVGFGLVGLITVSVPTIAVTYAVDCYKPVSGQIMTICTVAKNSFGFAMSFFINNWAAKSGFAAPCMMLMGLTVGFGFVGVVGFTFYGKKLRRLTRNAAIHTFE